MRLAAALAVAVAALTVALTLVTSSPAAPVATPPAAAATTSSAPRTARVASTVRVTFRDPSGRQRVESVPRGAVAPWCAITATRADVVLGAGTLASTTRAALDAARVPYPHRTCQSRRASGERRA